MLLDLSKLHGSRDHVERTFQPADFEPQDVDYRVVAAGPLVDGRREGRVARPTGVTGRVKTHACNCECGRCLEAFPLPVDAAFELRYVPQAEDAAAEAEREITEDDLTTAFYTRRHAGPD